MKLLPTIYDSDLLERAVNTSRVGYRLRTAARAIVYDDANHIALLRVGRDNYYKLPGGGIEDGEDQKQALRRELLEEIGCEAEIIGEVGEIVQYLDQIKLKQTSYCYLAKQIGEKNKPNFTDEELEKGFEIYWANDIDEAIKLLGSSKTNYDSGTSIVKRDLTLLVAAKSMMQS